MLTRLAMVTTAISLILAGCGGGGSGGGGPTSPTAAVSVAGSYAGTGSLFGLNGDTCDGPLVGFPSPNVEVEIRQTGNILNMDVSVAIQSLPGFAPVVCSYDGTLTGTDFSSTFRSCSASASQGTDPTQGIECADGSTRNATATGGHWFGSFAGTQLTGEVRVAFTLVDPATGEEDGISSITRNVDLIRAN